LESPLCTSPTWCPWEGDLILKNTRKCGGTNED
jgi:hypothetical protein